MDLFLLHHDSYDQQGFLVCLLFFLIFNLLIYLKKRECETAQAGGGAEGEEKVDSLLSRKSEENARLQPRILGP